MFQIGTLNRFVRCPHCGWDQWAKQVDEHTLRGLRCGHTWAIDESQQQQRQWIPPSERKPPLENLG